MHGCDDLHAAIAVEVGCNRWRQHVLVLLEGWVMLQVVACQRPEAIGSHHEAHASAGARLCMAEARTVYPLSQIKR